MDLNYRRKAWFPAANRFADAIGHSSNYPLAYVYAMFLALSGHILGRRTYIRYATPLYPNMYICLVGPSALTHKSTAIGLALESLGDTLEGMFPMRGLTTRQGLLIALQNNSGTGLIALDELASFILRKQDYASDLMAALVELYSCPRTAGNYTRYNPIEISNIFLSFISGSTTEWLRQGLTTTTLMAGFGNRMTFVLGDARPTQPWPKAPLFNNFSWDCLWNYKGVVRLSEEAQPIWDDWYADFDKAQHECPPFLRVLRERLPEKILKATLVMAAWRNVDIVDDDLLLCAIDWSNYLSDSLHQLAPSFENEDKRVLAAIGNGTTRRQLFEVLSHDMPIKRIREAVTNLHWLGYLTEVDGVLWLE